MVRKMVRVLLVLSVLATLVAAGSQMIVGASGSGCPTAKHPCLCPQIVAPVICDGGCTYLNGCYASCAGAKHCVPNPL